MNAPGTAALVRDPFGFELFKNAVFAIADEMALTVCRTTYSAVLRDNMDFSTALTDGEGRLIAQGLTLPAHLGSIPTAILSVLRHFGDDMHPGDVFIMNDPFDGGMHLAGHLRGSSPSFTRAAASPSPPRSAITPMSVVVFPGPTRLTRPRFIRRGSGSRHFGCMKEGSGTKRYSRYSKRMYAFPSRLQNSDRFGAAQEHPG